MSDLISRQALCENALNQKDKSVTPNDIMRFPSAQPYSEADIQKMQDLEQAEIQKAYELGKLDAESRWIPTKVKPDPDLPEDDMSGYFLVTLHTYGNIGFDMDEYEVKKMRWDRVNGWVLPVHSPAWIEEALTQDVLAWKPCPEPYREDGAE